MLFRSFRVLQFDTVTCRQEVEGGSKYVLTVIDCFSRWPWLIPIEERTAITIANALLLKVLIDLAMFPCVLRSDNAQEFVGEVVAEMNKVLEIRHITGSAYHPQSQGMVESMHKTMNHLVRGLVQEHPEDWENVLPYAQCILRITPLKALGGRSPYEVVTGLRPKLPRLFEPGQAVQEISVNDYSKRLLEYFRFAHADVQRAQLAAVESAEGESVGRLNAELNVGDLVVVRREPTASRTGPLRFQQRAYPEVYRVSKKLGRHTFNVCSLTDPDGGVPFSLPLNAERLVKVDMPEFALAPSQARRLEMLDAETDEWVAYDVERFARDGRVKLRCVNAPDNCQWVDLSRTRYRWLLA